MEKLDMKKWSNNLIKKSGHVAIPIMTNPGIELIGKTIYDAVTDGKVHHEAIMALNERFPKSAALTVIMDLTVEAEAFGAEIRFEKNEVPTVIGRLLADSEAINKLQIPDLNAGRIQQYLFANKLTAENNKSGKPVLAGCIGPFSLAGRLYEMSEMMILGYIDPDVASTLLQKCTDFIIKYCQAIKETGVNGVLIAEPAAGLLSNDDCKAFSSIFVKQIVDSLQDDSFMIILHNCGNSGQCTEAMTYTGATGYHFGNKMPMEQALKECSSDVLVMGNIDPVSIMKDSSPQHILEAVANLYATADRYPNFVLSTGCDVPPNVPVENVEAFYKLVD